MFKNGESEREYKQYLNLFSEIGLLRSFEKQRGEERALSVKT